MGNLTLGHLWDADLAANKPALQEILTMAQGEMALEVFLRQVNKNTCFHEASMPSMLNFGLLVIS